MSRGAPPPGAHPSAPGPSAALLLDAADNRFVARPQLTGSILSALRAGRSIVLCGAPGVGKTRVAAECVRALADEAVVVAKLADVHDRAGMLARVAQAAGVWLSPAMSPAEAEAHVLRAFASRGPAVFVLDNFEQLPGEADLLVQDWMRATAMSWLLTSRRRVACDAEHLDVPSLEISVRGEVAWSDAATLMRFRAEEVARVRLDDTDRDAVAALVAALDGLPLAIELAAARLAVLTPGQLLARLDHRFPTLDGAPGAARRGLAAALDASFALLDDDARACLRACSVFRGGVRLDALEAVLGGDVDVLGALSALRNQSLLNLERSAGEYRYSLANSVRELVEQREQDTPAWDAARARHATFWAAEASDDADPVLGREIENLRVAFDWARHHSVELAARLALALSSPALGQPYGAACEIVAAVLDHAEASSLDEKLLGLLLFRRGTVRRFISDFEGAIADLDRARVIAERGGDRVLLADVLAGLGNALSGQADWEGSRRYLERALAVHPSPSFRPLALAMIANMHSNEDAYDRAEPLLREAIASADHEHDVYAGAFARLSLGILLVERGAFDEAHACLLDALSVLETSRSSRVMQARHLRAIALTHLARVKQETGDTAGALTDYHEAVTFAEEAGVRRAEAFALYGLASLLLELGELRAADDRIRVALPLMRENCKDVEGALVALQGVLFASRGAHDDAERFFRRAQALLGAHKRPVFSVALAVLRGETDGAGPFEDYADVRLARRLRAVFSEKRVSPPLFVSEDAGFFRSPETGETVSLARRKSVRGVLRALVEARLTRPGIPVAVEALVAAGWPGEKVLPAAGAERVYAAIATLRRLGLRSIIAQQADGYLVPADRSVVRHDPGA